MFEPSLSSSEYGTSYCRRSSAALIFKEKAEAFNLKTPLSTTDKSIMIDRACQKHSAGSIELALMHSTVYQRFQRGGTGYTTVGRENFESERLGKMAYVLTVAWCFLGGILAVVVGVR